MSGPELTRLPTLTEIVPGHAPRSATDAAPQPTDEERQAQRLLADLERLIEPVLEHRLRETLGPALARLSDALIREMRVELASTLQDLVSQAVSQELERRRSRTG